MRRVDSRRGDGHCGVAGGCDGAGREEARYHVSRFDLDATAERSSDFAGRQVGGLHRCHSKFRDEPHVARHMGRERCGRRAAPIDAWRQRHSAQVVARRPEPGVYFRARRRQPTSFPDRPQERRIQPRDFAFYWGGQRDLVAGRKNYRVRFQRISRVPGRRVQRAPRRAKNQKAK